MDTKPGPRRAERRAAGSPHARALEAAWKAPGRAVHPQARGVQATGVICVHLRREVSLPDGRSVISAEFIACPTFSVRVHAKV